MKRFFLLPLAAFLSALASEAMADAGVSITFNNKSQYDIAEINLSPVKQQDWGDNQLTEALKAGASFTLNSIPANKYDVQFVDEDDDKCVVSDVKIAANETVDITDADLVGCQAQTEKDIDEEDEGDME